MAFLRKLLENPDTTAEIARKSEIVPIGAYEGVEYDEKKIADMKSLFEQQEKERQDKLLAQLFQGNVAGVNGLESRNVALEQEIAPQLEPRKFEDPIEKYTQERGYKPSTPTNIAMQFEAQKNKGITDKYLLGLAEAEKRARIMSEGQASRQEDNQKFNFDQNQLKIAVDHLKGLRESAASSPGSLKLVNSALGLIDKGVTGKAGQIKAFIAPYAESLGMNTQNMDDAATFQALTRVIVGPMRMDIIGPGPVSEWEQKLIQQMSGGGGQALAAAKALLTFYKSKANQKLTDYNNAVKDVGQLSPVLQQIYKPIEYREESGGESLSAFLSNPQIPQSLRAKAAVAKQKGIDEQTIIRALKQDMGVK